MRLCPVHDEPMRDDEDRCWECALPGSEPELRDDFEGLSEYLSQREER